MRSIAERGYAKINLYLDVTGRREDGYHDVTTVMQSLSLYDTVTVSLRQDDQITVSCDREGVPTDGRNLAVRAALLYRDEVFAYGGVHIDIQKKIPMAAGMAGGSADAAATLRAINRLCGDRLSEEALCALGARLGADVPFCIVGGSSYADGRGDRLRPIASMPTCFLVAACGGEGVSTPWAYGLLDTLHSNFDGTCYTPHSTDALMDALAEGDIGKVASQMYNVFEAPILGERPVAAAIREDMLAGGALGAMMSGSGPSVFGIFENEQAALRVAEQIEKRGCFAALCRPVACAELV